MLLYYFGGSRLKKSYSILGGYRHFRCFLGHAILGGTFSFQGFLPFTLISAIAPSYRCFIKAQQC